MSHAYSKRQRIDQIEQLLWDNPGGFTRSELARKIDVDPGTITKYLKNSDLPFVFDEDDKLKMNRYGNVARIVFDMEEITMLDTAARLLIRQTNRFNPHVASILRKLARTTSSADEDISNRLSTAAAIADSEEQMRDNEYLNTIKALTDARNRKRKVELEYQVDSGKWIPYLFSPYFIEPYAPGLTTHVVGLREPPRKIRTFKLERIRNVKVSVRNAIPPPENFDPDALLEYAWGIWYTNEPPELVELKFNPTVQRRVLETRWHRKQEEPIVLEDGSVTWRCLIAEPREMIYWVQGWGKNVEVVAPAWMKNLLRQDALDRAKLYGVSSLLDTEQPTAAIAHTKNDHGLRHDLIAHLHAVADLAAEFAKPFGGEELARCLGLWHDIGKFHPDFQAYLFHAEENPTAKKRGPDHKAAGVGIALKNKLDLPALILQGHHGGLQKISQLQGWYTSKKEAADEATLLAQKFFSQVIDEPVKQFSQYLPIQETNNLISIEFFLRFLFSTLVDADFLDTEQHFNFAKAEAREHGPSMTELWKRFQVKQQELKADNTRINTIRNEIYDACIKSADSHKGLFKLTVPTGGGKTRSGLGFALRHAQKYDMCRVIVVVPFITITEQTVGVYREILEEGGDDVPVVLEHHSSAIEGISDEQDRNSQRWNRLAAENWDASVIVTTTVQFFESLFANKTSHCRKLHRIANSVIVLDEAQALPVGLLDPILDGLRELCTNYGCTVVLSTATQPAFQALEPFHKLQATEIVPEPEKYFQQLKRVEYEWRMDEPQSWEQVAGWMRQEKQVLTIVNTKKDALALLDALDDPNALHLSTLLCGAHRRAVIAEIKTRLKPDQSQPCRVVATQVVEAGVDIDFPVVMRAFGPLDSIIQAAGRANRNGNLSSGRVVVFEPAEGGSPLGHYEYARQETRTFLNQDKRNMDDPNTVARYFQQYFRNATTDARQIQLQRGLFDYPEVSKNFRMIDQETINVVVDYESKQDEIDILKKHLEAEPQRRRAILRSLQPYLVSIAKWDFNKYQQQGFVLPLLTDTDEQILVGDWKGRYDVIRGLQPKNPALIS